jgi:branched-chain amino acid transport system permease protein
MSEFVRICIGGLIVGCIYALVALGFSLVYRVTAAVNLAQGGFCVLSALIAYTLGQTYGLALYMLLGAFRPKSPLFIVQSGDRTQPLCVRRQA